MLMSHKKNIVNINNILLIFFKNNKMLQFLFKKIWGKVKKVNKLNIIIY